MTGMTTLQHAQRDETGVTTGAAVGRNGARPRSGRGRRWWLVSVGGLLVVACAVAFAVSVAKLGDRVSVLAVARPVPAGDTISAADLRRVSAADPARLGLVRAADEDQVVGHTAAQPLVPGVLLTLALVGDAEFPPAGEMVASLSLKPGQVPSSLAGGAHVAVFVQPQSSGGTSTSGSSVSGSGAGSVSRFSAVVVSVESGSDAQGAVVVTVLVPDDAGPVLAAAPADGVVLMQTSPKDG
jgi:hypothetical protein